MTLRWKRIKPQGSASRRNARSFSESPGPATPTINARIAPISVRPAPGSSKTPRLVFLDQTSAARSLQPAAHFRGLLG